MSRSSRSQRAAARKHPDQGNGALRHAMRPVRELTVRRMAVAAWLSSRIVVASAAIGIAASGCALATDGPAGAGTTRAAHTPGGADDSTLTQSQKGLVYGLRMAREDWPAAKAAVQASPQLAQWVERQRAYVRAWAALGRERADLVGGWVHDYVDTATGVPMVWTEQTPEPPSGATASEMRFKQAWVAHVRQRNTSHVLIAARLFRLTDDVAMRDWAIGQLDFYAEQYERWPLRTVNGRGRMFRHGLDEAYAVFNLLDAARLLADAGGAERTKRWNERLFRPMAVNLSTVTSPMTNVAVWHGVAMAAIGLHLGDDALVREALEGPQGVRATLARGITADGLWFEGSLGYNQYVIDALSQLLVQASVRGQASRFAYEHAAAMRLLLAPLALRFPDGSLPSPGDVTAPLAAMDERSHRLLFRVVPTWYGIRAATRTPSWERLLDPPADVADREPALPRVVSRNFAEMRMAVLRAGEWQAFVHYGQATAHHAQEEALTYELHHGRTGITRDAGTVAYASPFHQGWFRRAAAHNVPLVDGHGQRRWAPGDVLEFDAERSRLTVRHADYRADVRVDRRYQTTEAGFVERTRFDVDARGARARRLGTAFHTDCAVQPDAPVVDATSLPAPPATQATTHWNIRLRTAPGAVWAATLACGDGTYRLRIAAADGSTLRIYVGDAPARQLPSRRALVYAEVEGVQADLITEIGADR